MTDCERCRRLRIQRDKYKLEAELKGESSVYWAKMYFDAIRDMSGGRMELTKAVGRDTVPSVAVKGGEQC